MKSRAAIFFGLYLAATIYLTLFPWEFRFYPKASQLEWVSLVGRREILDFVLNMLLFAPLGVSGFVAFGRRWWSAAAIAAFCSALSYGIESLQLWTPARFGNLTDFAANSAGAAAGCAIAWWVDSQHGWPELIERPQFQRWRLTIEQILFLGLWLLWHTFPFIPTIALRRLSQFVSPTPWSWIDFEQVLLGTAILQTALAKSPWRWVALLALPAQAFLLEHDLSYAALAGAVAGVGMAGLGIWRRALPWILPVWLAVEEFRPFSLGPSARPILWQPFQSWFDYPSLHYYAVIFHKLFFYTATVWGLREASKRKWIQAVGAPLAILAAGEWSQQYLEGRTPEVTDLVLLVAGAALLALCTPRERKTAG